MTGGLLLVLTGFRAEMIYRLTSSDLLETALGKKTLELPLLGHWLVSL